MDIGVSQAGFKILVCVELDKEACASLKANHERQLDPPRLYEGDVRALDPEDLLKDLPGASTLDLLFGGAPCQAFSQIGKQKSLEDERGPLLFEILRFARELKPRAIMVEQVKGLLSAKDASGKKGGCSSFFGRLGKPGLQREMEALAGR